MYKAIIFDFDGTLVDTVQDIGSAANHALTYYKFNSIPLNEYTHLVGRGMKQTITSALALSAPYARSENPQIDRLLYEKIHEYYKEHPFSYSKVYPGILSLLKQLQASGTMLYIISNKDEDILSKIVSHFFSEITFHKIVGINAENNPDTNDKITDKTNNKTIDKPTLTPDIYAKPNPYNVLKIIEELKELSNKTNVKDDKKIDAKIDPMIMAKDILFVGDSEIDFLTAQNAKIDFGFVSWGYGSKNLKSVFLKSVSTNKIIVIDHAQSLLDHIYSPIGISMGVPKIHKK
ncbi:MAG: HAD family hydrolase [Oligoflexia bacterium]|nr:HAD family hydrolase [Oligoflexia bacterium]